MNVVVATLVVVVALLALLVVGLLRSHAEILRALHDLGVNLDPDEPDGTFSARRPRVSSWVRMARWFISKWRSSVIMSTIVCTAVVLGDSSTPCSTRAFSDGTAAPVADSRPAPL